jgi:hypothetical protein
VWSVSGNHDTPMPLHCWSGIQTQSVLMPRQRGKQILPFFLGLTNVRGESSMVVSQEQRSLTIEVEWFPK